MGERRRRSRSRESLARALEKKAVATERAADKRIAENTSKSKQELELQEAAFAEERSNLQVAIVLLKLVLLAHGNLVKGGAVASMLAVQGAARAAPLVAQGKQGRWPHCQRFELDLPRAAALASDRAAVREIFG